MTRQTSLHGWTVPTEGDENYEDTFDDFFVDLDTNGELRDVESNLQNYSPKSGAKFVATDTENRYIGDGSTWNKVVSSGKNPNFDSINTDDLIVGVTRTESKAVTLDEDEAKSIDVAGDTIVNVMSAGAESGNVGSFVTAFDGISTAGQNGMTNEGNTDLGSQTGTDGTLNISRNENALWLENRTGKGTGTWEIEIKSGE